MAVFFHFVSFLSLPKFVASASEKASHGLKAPSDSSLGSLSQFKLNPQPMHVMSQLDWPSLTPSPSLCIGVRACNGGAVYKCQRGKGICGDEVKAPVTERWLPFFLFAVVQRPCTKGSGGQVRHRTNPLSSLLWAPECGDTSCAIL